MRMGEIQQEIDRLEGCETTYDNCFKLSALYTIRDHIGRESIKIAGYSEPRSEFLQAIYEAPIEQVLYILDEHMDCIRILHRKEYSAIINRIKSL